MKANKNQKNEDQTKKNKMKDKTKCFKAWHENQDPR